MRALFFTEDLPKMGRKKIICFDFTVFHWVVPMKQNKQRYFYRKAIETHEKRSGQQQFSIRKKEGA